MHVFNGSLGIWLYVGSGLSESIVLIILASCVLVSLSFDLLRLNFSRFNQWAFQKFSSVIRIEEKSRLSGTTTGLGTTLILLLIFPRETNILMMMFVTYADPMGSIIGNYFGKHSLLGTNRTWEGSLGVFVAGVISSLLCVYWLWTPGLFSGIQVLLFIIGSGLIAALAEAILPRYDDNFVIPLLSSPLLLLLFKSIS